MNKANECTCPSGDGSLRHPCPSHPAVEQAGGDERDFQAEGAQEVPSPVSQEYDRHLISLLRKGEALPGHQEEAADEIERLRDWNNHLNNTVLPNILNPNFLMLMKGGERLLDLCTKDGKFIGVSLNDMKDVFDWMVTHARIAPDHAALAQPSPTLPPFAEKVLAKLRRFYDCAEDFESGGVDIGRHWLDLLTQLGLLNRVQRSPALWEISQQGEDLLGTPHPSPAQAEKAEAERPEVVAYLFVKPDGTLSMDAVRHKPSQPAVAVMTVAQHERIVKAWIERWKAYIELSAKIAAQRDAALARVAELEAKLSDPTAVHQWQFSNAWFDGSEEVVLKAGKEGSPIRTLYTAPAQAQHSVPEGLALIPVRETEAMHDAVMALLYKGVARTDTQKLLDAYIAAAPGKEVPQAWLDVQAERRRQITAEGWTPEHDDEHDGGQIAQAAGCYALHAGGIGTDWPDGRQNGSALFWPWDKDWWKPTTPRRDLVKACALALAEIERLDRAAPGKEGV
ncbi:hypothetical protein ACIUW1_11720 [Pseudomonas aeruginosa]